MHLGKYFSCRPLTIVVSLSLLAALGHPACTIAQEAVETAKVDRLVQPYLDSKTLGGLSVGILHRGKKTFVGYGSSKSASAAKPDENTVYEIGSITKVFTSLLLADAINRGLVKLDQPITELFPSDLSKPHASLSKINFKQLSTHTSGLPRMPSNFDLSNVDNPYATYDPQKMFEFLHDHRLTREPGKKTEYSNLGVGLLGYLIASKQKTEYEALLKEKLLAPLQMNDSVTTLNEKVKPRLAQGHDSDGIDRGPWDFLSLAAAGAIRSTAADMLKFAEANLHPSETMREMFDLAWKEQQPGLTKDDRAMGLGWFIAGDGHTRFHNGQTGGYHSALFISRKLDLAVVILSNTATGEVDRLAEDIFKMVAGDPVEPRKFDTAIVVPEEVMKRYVGVYELVPNVDFTVSVQDGMLMVGLTGQQTIRVYPKSETLWEYKVVKATITFRQDKEGNWNELVLFQNGIRQRAKRKP